MAAKETKLNMSFPGSRPPQMTRLRVRQAFPMCKAPMGPEPAYTCAGVASHSVFSFGFCYH